MSEETRPTPETDDKVKQLQWRDAQGLAVVPADFARYLERQRDEARETLIETERERDEAKEYGNSTANLLANISDTLRVRNFTKGQLDERVIALAKSRDAALAENTRLREALRFYAGKLRADGNGYEFDKEPDCFQGSIARAALNPPKTEL